MCVYTICSAVESAGLIIYKTPPETDLWKRGRRMILISFHGCRQAGRSAFISYGAHENTAGSMVHAVLVDYKSKISRGHT